jgi:hypothetical protein
MKLPNSWQDLSQQQFIDIAAILSSGTTDYGGRIKLLWILSGLPAKKFTRIPIEEVESYLPQTEWVKELIIERSFFPSIATSIFKKIKGPEDRLQNFTLDQFILTDYYLSAYLTEKSEENLNSLLLNLFAEQSGKIKKLPGHIKNALFINFTGMRAFFVQMYPGCFSKEASEGGIQSALHPWDKMKDDLAGPKFGKVEEVGQQNAHLVFTHLQNNIEKAAKKEVEK